MPKSQTVEKEKEKVRRRVTSIPPTKGKKRDEFKKKKKIENKRTYGPRTIKTAKAMRKSSETCSKLAKGVKGRRI